MSVAAPLPASWQPMCQLHLTMSWCNRTTGSDVIATAVTTLVVAPTSSSKTPAAGRMTKAAALPYRSAGPQLPHSLSHAKRCELLIQERDAFMQSLNTERAARAKAEAWASTRIQVTAVGVFAHFSVNYFYNASSCSRCGEDFGFGCLVCVLVLPFALRVFMPPASKRTPPRSFALNWQG